MEEVVGQKRTRVEQYSKNIQLELSVGGSLKTFAVTLERLRTVLVQALSQPRYATECAKLCSEANIWPSVEFVSTLTRLMAPFDEQSMAHKVLETAPNGGAEALLSLRQQLRSLDTTFQLNAAIAKVVTSIQSALKTKLEEKGKTEADYLNNCGTVWMEEVIDPLETLNRISEQYPFGHIEWGAYLADGRFVAYAVDPFTKMQISFRKPGRAAGFPPGYFLMENTVRRAKYREKYRGQRALPTAFSETYFFPQPGVANPRDSPVTRIQASNTEWPFVRRLTRQLSRQNSAFQKLRTFGMGN